MKKITTAFAILAVSLTATAQTQKDWYLIGGNLSNIGVNFQKNNTSFSFEVTPKVAWFIKDNLALGGEVNLGFQTGKGYTTSSYGIGPLVRYYFTKSEVSSPAKTRFFGEANVGFFGQNTKVSGQSGVSTNGLGFGFGPGLAYFINQNVALEALVKYNGTVGFGNSTTNNALNFGLGIQVYLPKSKLQSMSKEAQKM